MAPEQGLLYPSVFSCVTISSTSPQSYMQHTACCKMLIGRVNMTRWHQFTSLKLHSNTLNPINLKSAANMWEQMGFWAFLPHVVHLRLTPLCKGSVHRKYVYSSFCLSCFWFILEIISAALQSNGPWQHNVLSANNRKLKNWTHKS